MKHSRVGLVSFVIGVVVFVQAVLVFLSEVFNILDLMALIVFPIILIVSLPEFLLGSLPQSLGFPIVLPLIGLVLGVLSFREENAKKMLGIWGMILSVAGPLLFFLIRLVK